MADKTTAADPADRRKLVSELHDITGAPEGPRRGRPVGGGAPKPPKPEPPVDTRPLAVRLAERFEEARAKDHTIKRFKRQIADAGKDMRRARQKERIALNAIQSQEGFLKRESAKQLSKELGTTIPGFTAGRETPQEALDRINAEVRAAMEEIK